MEITLDLVWNGRVDKNNRFVARSEIEKALNSEINKDRIMNNNFLVEGSSPINISDIYECKMKNVIGYVKSFDLDNYKATIVVNKDVSITSEYQLAFKKLGYVVSKDGIMVIHNIIILSCYLIHKDVSSRIDV